MPGFLWPLAECPLLSPDTSKMDSVCAGKEQGLLVRLLKAQVEREPPVFSAI